MRYRLCAFTAFTIAVCSTFFLLSFSVIHQGYKIGDKASDFKLKNINGQFLSLSDFKDTKGYVIVFMCNHCPCSGKYESRLINIDKKYKSLGYPLVAINSMDVATYPTESLELMKARASMKKFTFPYLSDNDKNVATLYGAPSTPYVYILQKSGNDLVVKYTGGIDDNMQHADRVKNKYVEMALDQLLKGEEITTPITRAFGCSLYH